MSDGLEQEALKESVELVMFFFKGLGKCVLLSGEGITKLLKGINEKNSHGLIEFLALQQEMLKNGKPVNVVPLEISAESAYKDAGFTDAEITLLKCNRNFNDESMQNFVKEKYGLSDSDLQLMQKGGLLETTRTIAPGADGEAVVNEIHSPSKAASEAFKKNFDALSGKEKQELIKIANKTLEIPRHKISRAERMVMNQVYKNLKRQGINCCIDNRLDGDGKMTFQCLAEDMPRAQMFMDKMGIISLEKGKPVKVTAIEEAPANSLEESKIQIPELREKASEKEPRLKSSRRQKKSDSISYTFTEKENQVIKNGGKLVTQAQDGSYLFHSNASEAFKKYFNEQPERVKPVLAKSGFRKPVSVVWETDEVKSSKKSFNAQVTKAKKQSASKKQAAAKKPQGKNRRNNGNTRK